MNEDQKNPQMNTWIEPELEARIVAWVAGDASPFEIAELERLVAEKPELAIFKRRIEAVHGLVGRAAKPDAEPLRMSEEKRAKLLAALGVETKTPATPAAPVISIDTEKRRRKWWQAPRIYYVGGGFAAACLTFFLVALTIPAFVAVKTPVRPDPGATVMGGGGSAKAERVRLLDLSVDESNARNAPAAVMSPPPAPAPVVRGFGGRGGGGLVVTTDLNGNLKQRPLNGSADMASASLEGRATFDTRLAQPVSGFAEASLVTAPKTQLSIAGQIGATGAERLTNSGTLSPSSDGVPPQLGYAMPLGSAQKELPFFPVTVSVNEPPAQSANAADPSPFAVTGAFTGTRLRSDLKDAASYVSVTEMEAAKRFAPGALAPATPSIAGAGSLALQGQNTYSGAQPTDWKAATFGQASTTTLSAGTLGTSGAITVNGGATLQLGQVTGGTLAQVTALDRLEDKPTARNIGNVETAAPAAAGTETVKLEAFEVAAAPAPKSAPANVSISQGFILQDSATHAAVEEAQKKIAALSRDDRQPGVAKQKADTDDAKRPTPATPAEPPPSSDETSTAKEPVSTFSLHVSDVAFRLAQAAMAGDTSVTPDRIRPEEFYNAFDYGDPSPTPAEKVSCRIEQAAHPFLQQRNLVRIAMKVAASGRLASQSLRLTVLLDTSGSMEREDRATTSRRALEVLASLLGPNDRLTLIGFARTPRLIAEAVTGDQAQTALDAVARTPAEGGTNLEEALKLGAELAQRHRFPGARNRIVLITDGAANLGNADPARLAAMIELLRQGGIAFDACGVGRDGIDDAMLEPLTRKGDGRYYLIDSPEAADAGFARQLAGAFRPAAENVKVQVRFNPARVASYRLIGFEKHRLNEADFRNDAVDAAELAAEENAVAVYQVEPLPQGDGELGEVSVRFRDPATSTMVERTWALPYDARAPAFDRATPSMQLAGLAALFTEKLRGTPLAAQFKLNDLVGPMNQVRASYPNQRRIQEFAEMFERSRRQE